MSFESKTYRVLIASPSDMAKERKAATEAVNDWNAQHAVAESIVLLPVKWDAKVRREATGSNQLPTRSQVRHPCRYVLDEVRLFHRDRRVGNRGGDRPVRGFRKACFTLLLQPPHRPK
jgi:hypothetical protein